MTRKTPVQRLEELEQRRLEIERKAKEEKSQIAKAKRRVQGSVQKQQRKDETRKKILVGSMYLDLIKNDPDKEAALQRRMDKFLTRDSDRKIFDFTTEET
jgi:large subunit ribosomal protein L7/L12